MKILYLHGLMGGPNGRKVCALRGQFGQDAVVEPPYPGLAHSVARMMPVADALARKFGDPRAAMAALAPVLFGADQVGALGRIAPELRDLFSSSVNLSQALYDQHRPDLVVGSSLGASVAMALETGDAPQVLVAPVWSMDVRPTAARGSGDFGSKVESALPAVLALLGIAAAELTGFRVPRVVKPATFVLHSANDEVFDVAHSRTLLANSPLRAASIDEIATAGRVADAMRGHGYAVSENGRLLVIGNKHQCNNPDPADVANRDPTRSTRSAAPPRRCCAKRCRNAMGTRRRRRLRSSSEGATPSRGATSSPCAVGPVRSARRALAWHASVRRAAAPWGRRAG